MNRVKTISIIASRARAVDNIQVANMTAEIKPVLGLKSLLPSQFTKNTKQMAQIAEGNRTAKELTPNILIHTACIQ